MELKKTTVQKAQNRLNCSSKHDMKSRHSLNFLLLFYKMCSIPCQSKKLMAVTLMGLSQMPLTGLPSVSCPHRTSAVPIS